jgi:superfamily II DNA/RNA helicase
MGEVAMASDDSTIPLFKTCTACKKEKALLQFGRQRLGKYGRRSICLVCHNEAGRQWKSANTEHRRTVKRQWRIRNREKEQSYRRRARLAMSEESRIQTNRRRAQHRQQNRQRTKEVKRAWELANPEAVRAMKRREYLRHKDAYMTRTRRFQQNNPHLTRLYGRIARQRRRAGGFFPGRLAVKEAIQAVLEAYRIGDRYWDVYEGRLIDKPTVDHIVPIHQYGPTTAENLCLTSRAMNASKGRKSLLLWLAHRRQTMT